MASVLETAQRILNPTAVFCNDREAYYNMLMEADTGTDAGLEAWCEYVLGGLKVELEEGGSSRPAQLPEQEDTPSCY